MAEKRNKTTESPASQAAALRRKAEELLLKKRIVRTPVSLEDAQRLFHELEVHQIELEMQNEELRRVQEELQASQARYFDLYDLAPVGYCTVSEKGLLLETNLTACSLLGVDRSKLLRQPLTRFILAEDVDGYYLHLKKLFATGQQQAFEIRMLRQDGALFWALLEATEAQGSETGGPVCRIVMSDITGLKNTEEALQANNAELELFTRAVSHDLKSPLVTIRAFLLHLEKDMADGNKDRVAQDLAYVHSAAEKMNALLDELLNLSRIGRVTNPCVEAPLQELTQEALALVAGRIDKRGVRVTVAQKPVLLYGDYVRLVEVFQNLVDNAVKFMGKQTDPLIEIGVEIKQNETVCFVRDNGMGIDPKHMDRLFGLFEKLNPGIEGSGLGLALVKRIVEQHGGRIWVESEGPGRGACFYFALPRKSSEL